MFLLFACWFTMFEKRNMFLDHARFVDGRDLTTIYLRDVLWIEC